MTKIEVHYVDHMGNDLRTVDAARVSMKKRSEWCYKYNDAWGSKIPASHFETHPIAEDNYVLCLSDRDEKLIDYLGKHHHKSPFNHNALTVYVKAPIFVVRQLVKHEYLVMNEVSRRYVDDAVEFYMPEAWRERAPNKKQGSGEGTIDLSKLSFSGDGTVHESGWEPSLQDDVANSLEYSFNVYASLLTAGVAPEQARMVLPQSLMTEFFWSGFLGAWAKMVNLRDHDDAQYETRLVAQQVDRIARELWPHSWEALRKYNVK